MANSQIKKSRHPLICEGNDAQVRHIFDTAYEALGNPIRMLDNRYHLLASSQNTVTDDPLWNELKADRKFSHDTVHFLISERLVDEMSKADTAIRLSNHRLKYDRIFCKVYDKNGDQIGHVTVAACLRPFAHNDIDLVKELCEHIGNSIDITLYSQGTEQKHYERTFGALIEGSLCQSVENEADMEILYANLRENLYIAVIDIMSYDRTLTHLEYFRDLFASFYNDYKFFVYSDNIAMLMGIDAPILSVKRDLDKLDNFFSNYEIYAGVSSGFENLNETNKYYKQALNALNYGTEDNNNQHIFIYDEFKLFRNINLAADHLSIEKDFCNPVIFAMIDFDTKHQTSYYHILRTYFMTGHDVKLASEQLEISPNELNRQLSEIEDTFQIDRSNGNTMLSLHLSMKMREFFLKSN